MKMLFNFNLVRCCVEWYFFPIDFCFYDTDFYITNQISKWPVAYLTCGTHTLVVKKWNDRSPALNRSWMPSIYQNLKPLFEWDERLQSIKQKSKWMNNKWIRKHLQKWCNNIVIILLLNVLTCQIFVTTNQLLSGIVRLLCWIVVQNCVCLAW